MTSTTATTGNTGTSGTTGTTGTTGTVGSTGISIKSEGYSNTKVGTLLYGVSTAASTPFASSGTVYLDGAGTVLATYTPPSSTSTSSASALTQVVRSYVVYSNCTIAMSLNDAFGTNTAAAHLEGITVNSGNDIDLGLLQGSAGTTGTTTGTTSGTTGYFESNVLVKLVRPALPTCSASTLSGSYALIGTGAGVENMSTSTSTTGTIGTTSTPSSITLDFVIEPGTIAVNQNASASRYSAPELEFTESNGSQTILGYGIAQ